VSAVLAALAGAAASALTTWLAMTAGVLDMPNERSSHNRPTPRAGGLGLLAAAGAVWLTLGAPGGLAAIGALGGAAAAAALGLADDLIAPPASLKLALIALISLLIAAAIGPVTVLPVTSELRLELHYAAGLAGSALFVFVVINAANFMDGSDGMLAAGLLPAGAALALLGASDAPAALAPGLALAAGLAGFVVFNRPPARVFAGDAGSLCAGALAGAGALAFATRAEPGAVYLAPLLVLPFIADVLLTLLKRARGGRLSLSAHREHAYQIRLQRGWSHRRAARVWTALSTACAIMVLALSGAGPAWTLSALFAASMTAALLYAAAHRAQ